MPRLIYEEREAAVKLFAESLEALVHKFRNEEVPYYILVTVPTYGMDLNTKLIRISCNKIGTKALNRMKILGTMAYRVTNIKGEAPKVERLWALPLDIPRESLGIETEYKFVEEISEDAYKSRIPIVY
jgi:hypothetical protein